MTPQDVHTAAEKGAIVLDMRTPRPFAEEHIPGAVNLQFNRADLVDRAEMILPADADYIVHAEPEPIARIAAKLLQDAGFRVRGHLEGGLAAWRNAGLPTASLPVVDVDDLKTGLERFRVLDVRLGFEFRHAHVPGADNIEWTDTWRRADEVPAGQAIAVVCGDEVRSAAAASILQRAGRSPTLVLGGMVDWLDRGYPTEKTARPG